MTINGSAVTVSEAITPEGRDLITASGVPGRWGQRGRLAPAGYLRRWDGFTHRSLSRGLAAEGAACRLWEEKEIESWHVARLPLTPEDSQNDW